MCRGNASSCQESWAEASALHATLSARPSEPSSSPNNLFHVGTLRRAPVRAAAGLLALTPTPRMGCDGVPNIHSEQVEGSVDG